MVPAQQPRQSSEHDHAPALPHSLFPCFLGLGCSARPAASADDVTARRSITISANGSVTAVPDLARITSGVATEAPVARDAVAKNSEAMQKVIAGLKASGIDDKDIQTASFHIEPRYTRAREGEAPAIDGYRVTNQVQVIVRNLDKLGDVLDRLVGLGANQMAGLSFDASKAETLHDDARKEAVANALRRAKLYADAAGVELGEVLTIEEGGGGEAAAGFCTGARDEGRRGADRARHRDAGGRPSA